MEQGIMSKDDGAERLRQNTHEQQLADLMDKTPEERRGFVEGLRQRFKGMRETVKLTELVTILAREAEGVHSIELKDIVMEEPTPVDEISKGLQRHSLREMREEKQRRELIERGVKNQEVNICKEWLEMEKAILQEDAREEAERAKEARETEEPGETEEAEESEKAEEASE